MQQANRPTETTDTTSTSWANLPGTRKLRLKNIGQISSAGVDKKVNEEEKKVFMLNYLDIYNSKTFCIQSNDGFMQVTATDEQIATKDVLRGDIFFTPSSETIEAIGVSAVVLNDLPNTVYSYHKFDLDLIKMCTRIY